jgi:hypothetical protein
MPRRSSNEVVVIMWRDIPAQINGKAGDERHQVVLPHRFQKAIDRAAMVAGKKTAQDYVGEWRRTQHPLTGELITSVDEVAATIQAEFPNERLYALVANGGWDPVSPEEHPDSAVAPEAAAGLDLDSDSDDDPEPVDPSATQNEQDPQ